MKARSERIIATVEARTASTRLPGKVLKEVGGRSLLSHMVARLRRATRLDGIVLATTTNERDFELAEFAAREGIGCYRGSETDVMARVIGAGESAGADIVVELTGDCPIIDPLLIDQSVEMFLHNPCDYLSNSEVRSYPDGMDVQVFRLETLRRSAALTADALDREHVTRHILQHPELFRRVRLVAPPDLYWPELGLTVDEADDLALIARIIEFFGDGVSGHVPGPAFSCLDVVRLLRDVHPEWVSINHDVRRKGLDQ